MIIYHRLKRVYKWIGICILSVVLLNIYLIYSFTTDYSTLGVPVIVLKTATKKPINVISRKESKKKIVTNTTILAAQKIEEHSKLIREFFNSVEFPLVNPEKFYPVTFKNFSDSSQLWKVAAKWVSKDQITPKYAPLLPNVLTLLQVSKVVIADVIPQGSQLKILLTLEGGQKALFKPKWYEVDTIIRGSVYSGRDRYNGEIVSFHLARLLGLNRVPLVTLRILNLTEIFNIATPSLRHTFFLKGNDTCFYGVCIYCNKDNAVCGKKDIMEGSLSLWLPDEWTLKKGRHPWKRSYNDKPTKWELHSNYCQEAVNFKQYHERLLDLIEISIFDFLIDNGDRHTYEMFSPNAKVLLIDNAKSFGNPYVDHIDILAPFYQCCKIRKTFLLVLMSFQNGALSLWVERTLRRYNLEQIIHKDHLKALDRRLTKIFSAIMVCFEEKGVKNVVF